MTFKRIKANWIIGTLFGLTFIFLLILRLGLFQKDEISSQENRILNTQTPIEREIWMNIFQQGQKIGYVHRQFFQTLEGYKILESVFMQINTMGMLQDIRLKTEGNLHPNLTLSSFNFELQSSLFHFKARGVLKGKILSMSAGPEGSERVIDLLLEKDTYLSAGILEALANKNLKPGEKRTFQVFDPVAMVERPVKISVVGEEVIPIMGRQEKTKKVSVDFMGVSQFAWIGSKGMVLKEEGPFGIKLEQVAKDEAL